MVFTVRYCTVPTEQFHIFDWLSRWVRCAVYVDRVIVTVMTTTRSSCKPKLCTKFEVPTLLCKYRSGASKFLGAPLTQGHPHFFLWVWFYDGQRQTQPVYQIWSRYSQPLQKYYRGTPKSRGAHLAQGHTTCYSSGIWWWALPNRSCMPNLKTLASSNTEIYGNLFLNSKFAFWATLWGS